MHTGRQYTLPEVVAWTRRETFVFFVVAAIPTALYALAGWRWLGISWLPIAAVGGAVAFITGFKNNASYDRLWEARKIWGAIVNSSRTWGILVLALVEDEAARRRLFHRHFAWLTALRYQLREQRGWESMELKDNVEYRRKYKVPEWEGDLTADLGALLEPAELDHVLARKNRAAHLIQLQSRELAQHAGPGVERELRRLELERVLAALVEAQGKSERIKNFPYPRQYATLNHMFVWLFIVLVPLGLVQELDKLGSAAVWFTIPISMMVAWVFHTMDKIGGASENPFQGGPNDVPISSMARGIEIDLREMLADQELPAAIAAENNILM